MNNTILESRKNLHEITLKEIMELDGEFLNDYELELLHENPLVKTLESCGFSGRFNSNVEWFAVELVNGETIDIYYNPLSVEELEYL